MLYNLIKIFAKIAIRLCCRNITINKKYLLQCNGPILLAVNHPNSFFDAIILCTLFNKPVYSLARGDIFKNRWIAKILYALHILPVYRTSEGVENLYINYKTFDECIKIFKQNGIVLIFSEGLCLNEWHLRPLKKGTARLAIIAWQQDLALKILPIGINYSSFHSFGKNIHINMGNFIERKDAGNIFINNGHWLNEITACINEQLQLLVYEINATDDRKWTEIFYISNNKLKERFITLPAFLGKMVHLPLYYPVKRIIAKKALYSSHYDSIMITLLLLSYPAYLISWATAIYLFFGGYYFSLIFIVLPFCGWCFIQTKTPTN